MRKLATVRRVDELQPIEGADKIELAVVDGWKCVIKKDEFKVGDLVVYCEVDSFLPIRDDFEFLRKSSYKRMDELEGFRLRTVKLRGQISQGLLIPTSILNRKVELGEEVTDELGIVKYEPPVPSCLNGTVIGPFPGFISKTDEERIQNLASDYDSFQSKPFYVSEKLDGTSFTAFLNEDFGVCGRNWQYAEDGVNSYWKIANELGLRHRLEKLGRRIALQAELVGPAIQKNRYVLSQQQLFVFNIFDIESGGYLDKEEMNLVCDQLSLKPVPWIGIQEVPQSLELILEMAQGKSLLNPETEREGLVWVHGSGANRISFKTISNRFLTKNE